MSKYKDFYCPYCDNIPEGEPVVTEKGRAACPECHTASLDNRGMPIKHYCPRCGSIREFEVDDAGLRNECTVCHLVRAGKDVPRDYSGWGVYTKSEYPEYQFDLDDDEFHYCSVRTAGSWTGWWCSKFNRPCIGSCIWKRERLAARRMKQSDMTRWM